MNLIEGFLKQIYLVQKSFIECPKFQTVSGKLNFILKVQNARQCLANLVGHFIYYY